jgi:hypothetical protein
VALLGEQRRRHRRIHAARHCDNDPHVKNLPRPRKHENTKKKK